MISEILLFLTWSYTFYTALVELERRRRLVKGNQHFPTLGKQRVNPIYYKFRTVFRYFLVSISNRFSRFIVKKYKVSETLFMMASQLPCNDVGVTVYIKRSKLNRILEDLYIFSDFPIPCSIDLTVNEDLWSDDEDENWVWGVYMDRTKICLYMDRTIDDQAEENEGQGQNLIGIIRENMPNETIEISPPAA